MEITIGAPVYGPEGNKIGEVSHVVCDGQTQQVTHVVVSKGWLLPRDIVVALADVETASLMPCGSASMPTRSSSSRISSRSTTSPRTQATPYRTAIRPRPSGTNRSCRVWG